MEKTPKYIPEIKGTLRSRIIEAPEIIRSASGIKIFGKRLKSFVFTTDITVIKNTNADAVMAVYPFTPQPLITQALLIASDVPVFCGVGGGFTMGKRVVNLGLDAEFKGAMGVVVNSPTSNEVIRALRDTIDIPIIVTVVSQNEDFKSRINSGASILNIAGGKNTAKIIKEIRSQYPEFPILATGGRSNDSIKETILAGANAVSFTPRSNTEIFTEIMDNYRDKYKQSEK